MGFVVGGPMTETALVAPILVALAVAATGAAIVCQGNTTRAFAVIHHVAIFDRLDDGLVINT